MAYQNIGGNPRFYINIPEFIAETTNIDIPDKYRTLPINPKPGVAGNVGSVIGVPDELFTVGDDMSKSFCAVLGHKLKTQDGSFAIFTAATNSGGSEFINATSGVGGEGHPLFGGTYFIPEYDGFSIVTFLASTFADITEGLPGYLQLVLLHSDGSLENVERDLGSVVIGIYYDMPNAPNLSLTMSREYGSTNELTTYKGGSISNTMNSSPPQWGDLGAWELGSSNPALSKSGRRSWHLQFSFMDSSDLFGSNQMLLHWAYPNFWPIYTGFGQTYGADPFEGYDRDDLKISSNYSWGFNYNLLTDNNFFSQVYSKTLGGTIPFLFQPDSSNNNPDQFAICRFKNNSLKATQSALNVYDISLSIEEVW